MRCSRRVPEEEGMVFFRVFLLVLVWWLLSATDLQKKIKKPRCGKVRKTSR